MFTLGAAIGGRGRRGEKSKREKKRERKEKSNFSIIIKKTRISIKFMTSNRKGKRIQL